MSFSLKDLINQHNFSFFLFFSPKRPSIWAVGPMRVGKARHHRTYGLLDSTWQRSRISQAGSRIYGEGGRISEAGGRIS